MAAVSFQEQAALMISSAPSSTWPCPCRKLIVVPPCKKRDVYQGALKAIWLQLRRVSVMHHGYIPDAARLLAGR